MLNNTIRLKIQQRLNKLASSDYDNLDCWHIVEAFNKAQVNWCRRNLHGLNAKQEGDEQSKRRIDDLQILIKRKEINFIKKDLYVESDSFPSDYFEWKRISANASKDCCDNEHLMIIYLAEEDNVSLFLNDENKKPSFEWGETFCTLTGNKINIYTNNDFSIKKGILLYYKQPVKIEIKDCIDPYTQQVSTIDIECEFKDDLIELFIDEAVKILAGDIESFNQQQIASQQVEGNN